MGCSVSICLFPIVTGSAALVEDRRYGVEMPAAIMALTFRHRGADLRRKCTKHDPAAGAYTNLGKNPGTGGPGDTARQA